MRPSLRSLLIACAVVCSYGLSAASPVAKAEWVDERVVDLFEVRSEFSLAGDAGQSLLEDMRRLRQDVESLLGIEADERPIEVNLFANRHNYSRFLELRIPGGASRIALYVKGVDRGRVYVHRHRGFEVDMRHECTHAILHNALPYVPIWLDEGLAEYFEVPADSRATGNPHLASIRRASLFHWDPSLPELEAIEDLSEMNGQDYRDSWAWVHFMLHGPLEARQTLSNYLYDVRTGNPAGRLSIRLAHAVPELQRQFESHFRHLNSSDPWADKRGVRQHFVIDALKD